MLFIEKSSVGSHIVQSLLNENNTDYYYFYKKKQCEITVKIQSWMQLLTG